MRLLFTISAVAAAIGLSAQADDPALHTFDADGMNIRYFASGTGTPVVLIHGLHSSAEVNWKMPEVFNELAKRHRVIAIGLPGHGLSGKPDDDKAYGEQLAKDVLLLLDHLEIERVHLVGYSVGGMVAMKVMVEYPDRVTSGTLGGRG